MPELSEAKRILLEKYLRGERPKTTRTISRRYPQNSTVPLSFGQQQLWLLAQIIPDAPVYNECVTVHLPGPLNITALEQSLNALINRHEAWRTSFTLVDGQPLQVIHPSLVLPLPIVDLRHLPRAERETEARRLATEKALLPFDLTSVPLIRATLIRIDEEDHRLFLTLHHIIFDGITIYQVFLPELHALYHAFVNELPSPLPPLPIQYADYAVWQRDTLQGGALEEQVAYWRRQLAAAPPTLELPTDRPRPPMPSYSGTVHSFRLSTQMTTQLKLLARREGCTLYVLLLSAFSVLLHRYTSQEDILIGTAAAGRKQVELEKLMGIFINTLVMRTDLTGNPTFRQLLTRVHKMTVEAQAQQDVPFEYLVKELQPERRVGHSPLFQVFLMLEPSIPALPSGWTITHLDTNTRTSKFDLSLILEDRTDHLLGHLEYSTDLFDESTIARMVEHWQVVLEAILLNPDQDIAHLPLLTQKEQRQLLVEWNATQTSYPHDKCIHELFEEQVQRSPEATALILADQSMPYAELNIRANQLAHHLRHQGVGPEVVVGLCMDRSLDLIISLLAILKAGAAYVPLDPAYPMQQLTFMLQDTQARALITQKQFMHSLPVQDIHVICLEADRELLEQQPTENPVNVTRAEQLAYVMYTSGSTGRPKGVEIRHRSIARLVFGGGYARLDATRTILHMASISFDAATFEVWGSLLHGGRCVLFPERIPTPRRIGEVIHKHHVTTAWLTASLFNAVIDEVPEALQDVEQVLTGGEALSVTHIHRALHLLPTTQFINGYGPTESTTFTCCYAIPRELDEAQRSIPIGRPIGNTEVYILDRYMQPVPIGVPGELLIGGAGLTRGYLHRPEINAEKFIAHPFCDDSDARLYRTGDLVRYLQDGTIEFLGRLDRQVKIRGFRIEPGEIENVLGHHSAVREQFVQVHQNERGEKSLVAYVVPVQGEQVTGIELRRYLKEQLPEYMIPAHFIVLESLPLTPNGKLDHRALPAPQTNIDSERESFVAPKSMVHQQLIAIWQDLLNLNNIGITDNFFYLGGHSLLAARLVDAIERTIGKKISLAALFARPTIEQLALALQSPEEQDLRSPVVSVQRGVPSMRPFFYLHGDYMGGSFYCFTLARGLGEEQPFYVLDPYKFAGLRVPPTLEEMAAAHLQSLRSIQPEGPYLLGGFCNGGLVAYEMARQLHDAGQMVDLLLLIDPASPPHRFLRGTLERFCRMLHMGEDKQLDWFLRVRHIYKYIRFLEYRTGQQDSEGVNKLIQPTHEPEQSKARSFLQTLRALFPSVETLRQDWPGTYRWIASGYSPNFHPSKATFIWSSEEVFRKVWLRTIPAFNEESAHVIPGSHLISTAEQVNALTECLHLCLDKVQKTQISQQII